MQAKDDPDLTPEEKEFHMTVNKATQELVVHSEIGSISRHLLQRNDFDKSDERLVDGDIVAVTGTLPMDVLKVQQNEREHGGFSRIVATHE